jgi:hypothetical protein
MRTEAEWLAAIEEKGRGIGSRPSATSANLLLVDKALTERPASGRLWNRRGDLIQLLEEVDTPILLGSVILLLHQRTKCSSFEMCARQSAYG